MVNDQMNWIPIPRNHRANGIIKKMSFGLGYSETGILLLGGKASFVRLKKLCFQGTGQQKILKQIDSVNKLRGVK